MCCDAIANRISLWRQRPGDIVDQRSYCFENCTVVVPLVSDLLLLLSVAVVVVNRVVLVVLVSYWLAEIFPNVPLLDGWFRLAVSNLVVVVVNNNCCCCSEHRSSLSFVVNVDCLVVVVVAIVDPFLVRRCRNNNWNQIGNSPRNP